MLRGLIPDSCGTYFITVVKIFLLHWLQPFLYVLLIYAYYDEINHIQRTLRNYNMLTGRFVFSIDNGSCENTFLFIYQ